MTDAAATPAARPFSPWEIGLALRYLRARKVDSGVALISIIAFISIMAAVAVLIIVMSVMNGFRSELLGRIVGFQGHIYVTGEVIEPGADRLGLVRRLRDLPGVIQVEPLTDNQALLQGPTGAITPAIVRGVEQSTVRDTPLVMQRLSPKAAINSYGQGEYGGDQVLVGDRLALSLNLIPGAPLNIISPSGAATAFGSAPTQKSYTVGATFSIGMAEYDQAFVYMPLQQAQLFFGKEDIWDKIEIKVKNPDDLDAVKAAITRAAGPGAQVRDWRDDNKAFFNALQVERNVMRLIMMLIVVIAALNIISGLIMLVKNKTRDIAILRTMGASRGAILRIFMMSGSIVGLGGGFAGLILGVLFCLFIRQIQQFVEWVTRTPVFSADVYFLSYIPAKVEWSEVAFVMGWTLLVALLATWWPAWRGSRLDPVEALRYE